MSVPIKYDGGKGVSTIKSGVSSTPPPVPVSPINIPVMNPMTVINMASLNPLLARMPSVERFDLSLLKICLNAKTPAAAIPSAGVSGVELCLLRLTNPYSLRTDHRWRMVYNNTSAGVTAPHGMEIRRHGLEQGYHEGGRRQYFYSIFVGVSRAGTLAIRAVSLRGKLVVVSARPLGRFS